MLDQEVKVVATTKSGRAVLSTHSLTPTTTRPHVRKTQKKEVANVPLPRSSSAEEDAPIQEEAETKVEKRTVAAAAAAATEEKESGGATTTSTGEASFAVDTEGKDVNDWVRLSSGQRSMESFLCRDHFLILILIRPFFFWYRFVEFVVNWSEMELIGWYCVTGHASVLSINPV